MTDLMHTIFEHIQETNYLDYLPQQTYRHYIHRLLQQEQTLLDTCSAAQRELLEACQITRSRMNHLELEAMFQAAWAAARELG